jgi:hypothetical protein
MTASMKIAILDDYQNVATGLADWGCGRSRNSRWLRSRNSAVGGSLLMFYSLASFGVAAARPGRLLGR